MFRNNDNFAVRAAPGRSRIPFPDTSAAQLDGTLAEFFTQGKRVAEECGVRVCDAHAKWQQMARCGVDTTELLSNKINHPTKELNWLFAYELLNTIMQP